MALPCDKCDAKCCTYFCFEIDEPDDFQEFEDIRWFLCHEGVSIHIEDGDWYISLANRCKYLTAENRCEIYEDRPIICRNYGRESCDATPGGYDYEAVFNSPEDIEAYAREVLGNKAYVKARAKARAKADGKKKPKKHRRKGKKPT